MTGIERMLVPGGIGTLGGRPWMQEIHEPAWEAPAGAAMLLLIADEAAVGRSRL